MSRLSGKVAIVTGASKGIGAAIAVELGKAGAAVVVNYVSDKSGADSAVEKIISAGERAVAVQANLAEFAQIKGLVDQAVETYGQIDIFVNNAGVYQFASLGEITEEQFHYQFNVNVLAPILVTQQVVPHFATGGGVVINISSAVSLNPPPGTAVYSATKAAIDAVTRSLAKELGSSNIRVNSVNPGLVETEGVRSAGVMGSEFEQVMINNTPFGRVGQPEDIAKAVLALVSDDTAWITGEVVRVSGGFN